MAPPSLRSAVSGPFAHREFNGETLLEELATLRDAQVRQKQLEDCVSALKGLSGMRVGEASTRLRQIAGGRFAAQPVLARLLVRWAGLLRTEADVGALAGHFRRLAITSALIGALRRGGDRVVGGVGR